MGKLRKHTPPSVKRCINSCSGDKKLPLVVRTEDSQDLPNGWTLEVRNLKSGRTYKCYVSPTGSKFYSKQEISRHLKGERAKNHTSRSKKAVNGMQSTSNAVTVRKDLEELPPGWITEIKIRQTGDKIRKDPYYTDPVTGYIFRSKRDVFRYLDNGEIGRHAIKPKKRGDILESTDEKITPPTASKRQKLEGSAARRQLFTGQSLKSNETSKRKRILEPSVPEESKSLLEHTSVESDEWPGLGSLALVEDDDSNKTQGSRKEAVSASPAAGDSREQHQQLGKGVEKAVLALPTAVVSSKKQKQKLQDAASSERQGPKLRPRKENVSASPAAGKSPEKQQQLEKGVEKVGTALPTVVVSPKKQQQKLKDANLNEIQGPKLRSRKETALAPPAAVASLEKQQLVKGVERVVSVLPTVVVPSRKQQQKLEDADSNKTQEQKLRARKEIVSALPAAGVTPEKLQQLQLEKEVEKVVPAQPTVVVSPKKKQPKLENGVEKRGNRKTQLSSSRGKDEKQLNLPHRASKRLAGVNADPVPELVVRKRKSQVSAGVEDINQSLEQIDQGGSSPEGNMTLGAFEGAKAPSEGEKTLDKGGDPLQTNGKSNQCEKPLADQAEASESQRTEEVNQKPESLLDMPFGDSWPDPCLEFAFKTLTGAIPVEENLVMQDYFQPQLSSVPTQNPSSLALPDTSIDAFCQTDGLLRFDSMERPVSPRKFQENTTVFPASTSSGNIISFGGNTLQHPTSHENILSFGGNVKQQPSARGTNAKDR